MSIGSAIRPELPAVVARRFLENECYVESDDERKVVLQRGAFSYKGIKNGLSVTGWDKYLDDDLAPKRPALSHKTRSQMPGVSGIDTDQILALKYELIWLPDENDPQFGDDHSEIRPCLKGRAAKQQLATVTKPRVLPMPKKLEQT